MPIPARAHPRAKGTTAPPQPLFLPYIPVTNCLLPPSPRLRSLHPRTQALVLAPTREIAIQSEAVIRSLAAELPAPAPSSAAFVGGLPIVDDEKKLRRCAKQQAATAATHQAREEGVQSCQTLQRPSGYPTARRRLDAAYRTCNRPAALYSTATLCTFTRSTRRAAPAYAPIASPRPISLHLNIQPYPRSLAHHRHRPPPA